MAKKKTPKKSLTRPTRSVAAPKRLVSDLRQLIEQTRQQVSVTVNAALVLMYWHIGKRIREDVLKNERAEYGEEIVQTLSAQLVEEYGRGFGRRNLFRMLQFSACFPDQRIVSALSTQLSWSHDQQKGPFHESRGTSRRHYRRSRQKSGTRLWRRTND
jgi:hypothetical protein